MNYKTPGVYVEEISLFPPSVAQVETAIPAFIGYTETAANADGDSLINIPTRITSLLEYQQYYGGPHNQTFEVTLDDAAPYLPQSAAMSGGETPYSMHHSLQMYFDNGGGPCYIVSVGDYGPDTATPSLDALSDYSELKGGLDAVRKVDEVTLLVIPEALRLLPNEQYDLYKDALMQCGDLKDRFGIFDVRSEDTDAGGLRSGIGTSFLSYGAAYYPHLNTSIPHSYSHAGVTFAHSASDAFDGFTMAQVEVLAEVLQLKEQFEAAKLNVEQAETDAGPLTKAEKLDQLAIALNNAEKGVNLLSDAMGLVEDDTFTSTELDDATAAYETVRDANITSANTIAEIEGALSDLSDAMTDGQTAIDAILVQVNTETGIGNSHNTIIGEYYTNGFVASLTALLNEMRLTLPPSSTIAGIYAKVDESRGVWKAPANVSINRVSGPEVKLTIQENDDFNVHSTGKSINVIRSFTGKGTLVWGARTLDGNSNEWRYVSVRRFFNMVEESVKKASERFVFEPNDRNTWVKVKAMIENFLVLQWRAGALMGGKPEEAFFVKVGLGETMTQQDVLEGRMIVEIGMAAVRPAEFIILRFSHKMIES